MHIKMNMTMFCFIWIYQNIGRCQSLSGVFLHIVVRRNLVQRSVINGHKTLRFAIPENGADTWNENTVSDR